MLSHSSLMVVNVDLVELSGLVVVQTVSLAHSGLLPVSMVAKAVV